MKTLIIYAHPNSKSFNAAIKGTVEQELKSKNHEVRVRDLYQMNFNPILNVDDFNHFFQNQIPADIKEEQKEIEWADNLIFIYPTWWISMPAMLKGYIDRVFTNGFAFQVTENGVVGLLKGKKVIIFQTTGQPEENLKPYNLISSMEISMGSGTLAFCGIESITHKFFYAVPYITDEMRKSMLEEVKAILNK